MGGCIGVIALFIMLAFVGWVMDRIIPGRMPGGVIGGVVAAIAGGVIGGWLFGFLDFGPWAEVGGTRYYFIPGLLGGILLAVIITFVMKRSGGNQRY